MIELNRVIRETVDDDLRAYSGAPYSLPGVQAVDGDGRSQLAARDTRYDVIHIGFTDTLSAGVGPGLRAQRGEPLHARGVPRVLRSPRAGRRPGRHATAPPRRRRGAAHDRAGARGARRPEPGAQRGRPARARHLRRAVRHRARPSRAVDAGRARPHRPASRTSAERVVAFAPGGPYRLEWAELARAPSPREFCEGYRLDVCPPTDDRPFFFNMRRAGDVFSAPPPGYFYAVDPMLVLALAIGILVVLCALAFGLPLAFVPGRPPLASMIFFAAIGVGFLLFEIALIQRFTLFLGFPTYALSVVLFALLVFTGLGSLASSRLREPRPRARRRLRADRASPPFALQPLLAALIELPFAARVAVTVAPDRAAGAAARHRDADRARAASQRGMPRGPVGVGGQRRELGARLGARRRGRDHLGLHRPHPARAGVLPRGLGGTAHRCLTACARYGRHASAASGGAPSRSRPWRTPTSVGSQASGSPSARIATYVGRPRADARQLEQRRRAPRLESQPIGQRAGQRGERPLPGARHRHPTGRPPRSPPAAARGG